MFLNRHTTTPTNRNRGRIRLLMDVFLATDIMSFSDRPIDPLASDQYDNPVMENPGCVVCHRIMDPMAGGFMKWQEFDQQGEFHPEVPWYPDVFAPGYENEVMPVAEYQNATRWLADRIVADPRFPSAIARMMFSAVTGQQPLRFPDDAQSAGFAPALAAWEAQDAVLRQLADDFAGGGMLLKPLIRDVVLSTYFRAHNTLAPLSENRAQELANVGTARFVIPEVLGRKLQAVTGLSWAEYNGTDRISGVYNLLYGGINSDQVTDRLTTPNAIMTGIVWRMANDMSCELVTREFLLPTARRVLLPYVEVDTLPMDSAGKPTPGETSIRQNIQHLHAHVLGEALTSLDHVEIERTYRLFLETLQAGREALASGDESSTLHWRCQGSTDPETGELLPWYERVSEDPDYVVRSWMAVIAYLLSDYRFIYE